MKSIVMLFGVILLLNNIYAFDNVSLLKSREDLRNGKSNYFIENKGQWPEEVKFLAKINNLNAWITQEGVIYDYYRITEEKPPNENKKFFLFQVDRKYHQKGHIFKMNFLSSKTSTNSKNNRTQPENKNIEGKNKQDAYYNYFFGNNVAKWVSNVGLYKDIYVKNIYDGIDMHYYFDVNNDGNMSIRYDLVVQPNADISQIKIKIEGIDDIVINDKGELILNTSLGEIRNEKLYAFQFSNNSNACINYQDLMYFKQGQSQNIEQVECRFIKNNDGTYGFESSSYNINKVLIIDPILASTYIGASNNDAYDLNGSIGTDASGNIIICGSTTSTNFPTTTGAYDVTHNGNSDIFVSKFNSNLSSLIFSTFIGESQPDIPVGMIIDGSNNIIVTGTTQSEWFPTTAGVYDRTHNGYWDAFLLKLNSTGTSLIFSTFIGGSSWDVGCFVHIDGSNNFIITGTTESTNYPTTVGCYDDSHNGIVDLFISKFNSNATSLTQSTYLGGRHWDNVYTSCIDNSNNIFVGGSTCSVNFPTTSGCYDSINTAYEYTSDTIDAFICKMNPNLSNLLYSTFLGPNNYTSSETVNGIAIDGSGNIYVSGYTNGQQFPTTTGAYQEICPNNRWYNSAFLAKFNSTLSTLIVGTYLGGFSTDYPKKQLAIDGSGNIIVAGNTESDDFPTTADAFKRTLRGSSDIFLSKLNSNLSSLLYSTYLGGYGEDVCLELNHSSNISYLLIATKSADFPVTSDAFDKSYNGDYDMMVVKFKMGNENYTTIDTIVGTVYCAGDSIFIPFSIRGNFNAGNVFTAQLSDTTGHFANPITLGTLTSTIAGTIRGYIPKNTPTSSKYRIRIMSSNPTIDGDGYDNRNDLSISALPVPNIIGDTVFCEKSTVTMACSPSANNTYKWYVTNGTINGRDDTTTVNITWGNSPSATLKLVQKSALGCPDSLTKNIILNPMPSPQINGSFTVCASNNYNYTTSPSGGTTCRWKITGGKINGDSTGNNVNITWGSGTSGTLKLIQTTISNCIDSINQNIVINPLPTPSITGLDSVCEKNDYIYSVTNQTGHSYKWTVTGGTIIGSDSSNSILINWTSSGNGSIKIVQTVKATGCKDSASINIRIKTLPTPQITGNLTVCETKTERYTSNTSTAYKWEVIGGAISGSNSDNIVDIVWGSVGNGQIKLIQTNSYGCKDSITKNIVINSTPKPKVNGPNTVCSKDTSNYYTTSGPNIGNDWFVNGGVIIGSKITDTILVYWNSTGGNSKITLIQTDLQNGCRDSATYNVTVNPLPNPVINGPIVVPKGSQQTYSTTPKANMNNEWSVEGGTIATRYTNSIIVDWGMPGQGKVQLVQTNQQTGCYDTTLLLVDISNSSVLLNGSKSVCEKNIYSYNTQDIAGKTYKWYVTGGTLLSADDELSINILWNNPGTGKIKLVQTTTSTQFKDSVEMGITINPLPKPQINGDTNACSNCEIKYYTPFAIGVSNLWFCQGGTIIGDNSNDEVTVKWGIEGSGSLKIVQTNYSTGCKDSLSKTIKIDAAPKLSINGKKQVCKNSVETYTTSNISGAQNKWSITGGQIQGSSTGTSVEILWNTEGTWKIKLVQNNPSLGFKDSTEIEVVVFPLPSVSLTPFPEVCTTMPEFDLSGGSPDGGNYYLNGNLATKFNPLTAGVGTHKISYIYIDNNGCSDSASSDIVVVPAPPKPIITEQNDTLISSADYGNQWYYQGNILVNDTNKILKVTNFGIYSVKVRTQSGCESEMSDSHYYPSGGAEPIILADMTLNFSKITCEYTKIQFLKIKNPGGESLIITDANISGPNADEFTIEPAFSQKTINKGETDSLMIRFNPKTMGIKTATLTLTSNAYNDPNFKVQLNAEKDSVYYYLTNNKIDISVNIAQTQGIAKDTIVNTGNIPIVFNNPGEVNQDFTIMLNPTTILPSGGHSVVTIFFNGGNIGYETNYIYNFKDNICNLEVPLQIFASVGSSDTVKLILGKIEANSNERISLPIYIANGQIAINSGIRSFTANIRFNASLLEPVYPTPMGELSKDGKERIIPISFGVVPKVDSTLDFFTFRTMLGDDTMTTIKIENINCIGGQIRLDSIEGRFILKNICREGGARLVTNSQSTVQILQIKPNPVAEKAEIEIEVVEPGVTQLSLYNSFGQKVTDILNGEIPTGRHKFIANLQDIASGSYFIMLKTLTQIRVMRMDIVK